jgi:hydrogenase nickel incorporation protein HypA/HybF
MHELAVCQQLLSQVESIALDHRATAVDLIRVSIGPLSGVEAPLLEQAFTIARAGTIAAHATLELERTAIRICCKSCGATGEASPNMLLCATCGDWKVEVVNGTELMLMSVELTGIPEASLPHEPNKSHVEETEHV